MVLPAGDSEGCSGHSPCMGLLDAQGELAMGNPCCPYPCLARAECSTPSERPARRAEILRQYDTHPDHLATYKQDFDRDTCNGHSYTHILDCCSGPLIQAAGYSM